MSASDGAVLFQKANKLADRGRLEKAQQVYQQALTLEPKHAEAHNNLGIVLAQLGNGREALSHFKQALVIRPDYREAFMHLAQLLFILSEKGHAAEIIKDNLAVRHLIARAKTLWPMRIPAEELFADTSFEETVKNYYLLFYLGSSRLRDAEIEIMLTSFRAALLKKAEAPEIAPHLLAFACALARQCFINEYVFSLEPEEERQTESLRERTAAALEAGKSVPAHQLAILAAYTPLGKLTGAQSLLGRAWPPVLQGVLIQQVQEPAQEQKIREILPRLTPIEDETSAKVRAQYEENPYPRWVVASSPFRKLHFSEFIQMKFPETKSRSFPKTSEMLVAGCGTGSVVVSFAQMLEDAKVLAVDLSLSSLAYAKRMADMLRLGNVEFGQADILKLPALGRSFDVISSTGVMHHMADPFHAWRTLVSVLRPGGFMHVGFYSELARKEVTEAWKFIREGGYGKSVSEIRRFRSDLFLVPLNAPIKRATLSPDFYSLSDCRDLLFHEHELRVTIPQIKEFLAENQLEFVGWDFSEDVLPAYAAAFPKDKAATNLDNWHRFEEKHPHTFSQMYKLWVQKIA